ncbi:MAG: methionine-R-sulfoxide reductase [Candidatus Marsarchaeota archaeon]|nr:methionine-R-sulfoxide reductase [Candidatus Marsarchaeota archaeon]MCL5111637.1 methionine-R-sulfoxide reductase [Candidatus Marsarchaeota archaeon]
MRRRKLTQAEKLVIVDKGTEVPFTGEYDQFFERGMYVCRRCGAHLYKSERKFDAHCGWPSFDQEIRGAVKKALDPDGARTEITCSRCGAHLGHVFIGERLTKKNVRHCVNSLSMRFIPNSKRVSTKVRRDKHTEVIHDGVIVDADNAEEKY